MGERRNPVQEMEESFARIRIEEEEEGGLSYEGDGGELSEIDVRWCLVGRFLTESHIDFQVMQHKMASLWRPGRGMYVKMIDPNRYVFQFYHEVDITRVIEGSPWSFGRFQLVFVRLREGENPRTVQINNLDLWVQLHGMQSGFMSQRVVQDVGNYLGKFIESDQNNFIGVWRDYLRVRVSISLDMPLKRRMKLKKNAEQWCWVNFKYEAIPTFCFICGLIGHSEKFCERIFEAPIETIEKPYGLWMRAEPRRRNYTMGSKWLRHGGIAPVPEAGKEDPGEKGNNDNLVEDNHIPNKSGVMSAQGGSEIRNNSTFPLGENQGDRVVQNHISVPRINMQSSNVEREIEFESTESTGLLISNPKRRRTDNPTVSKPISEENNEDDSMLDTQTQNEDNQKNGIVAGAAWQARQAL